MHASTGFHLEALQGFVGSTIEDFQLKVTDQTDVLQHPAQVYFDVDLIFVRHIDWHVMFFAIVQYSSEKPVLSIDVFFISAAVTVCAFLLYYFLCVYVRIQHVVKTPDCNDEN